MDEVIYRQIILNNGDEVVCQILELEKQTVTVTNAMKLIVQYVDDDRYTGLTPYFSCNPDVNTLITINSNSIVASCVPHESLKALYLGAINDYNMDSETNLPSNVVSFSKPPDDTLH